MMLKVTDPTTYGGDFQIDTSIGEGEFAGVWAYVRLVEEEVGDMEEAGLRSLVPTENPIRRGLHPAGR